MIRRLHRWLGVVIAAWLAVATLSGLALLWADEYVDWRYPQLPETLPAETPDADVIARIVAATEGRLSALAMPRAGRPAYHAYLTDGGERLYHPETGALVAEWGWSDSLPAFLFELHAYLLAGEPGHTLVGILGCLVMVSLTSGAWLWLRRRAIFRLRYFWPRNAESRYLLRGHAAQGATLGPLFAGLVVTGVAMVFPGPFQSSLNAVLGASPPLAPSAMTVEPDSDETDWQQVLDAAGKAFPAGVVRFVSPPRESDAPVLVRLRNEGELHPNGRSYLVLHPASAEILETIDATRRGAGPAVFDALYPLHAGKTGWPGYRLLLTLLSLSLLFMALSGLRLMLGRRRLRTGATRALARCP
ncbi:PepSY-associated TM helix domain-containing protein [Lentisalinibacter salinarum]|uniref:PepSY-associated TM helix domain-containing protein n=1 Tax=Lentisalinibacter salinarum TaxID=2992239 RepID=UPI00386AD50A